MVRTWTRADAARALRRPTAADDKYSRGVLGMRTGSEAYPGAAVLGVEAAWRAGLGMVRYLGPDRAADLVLARRPETVTADGRVQAWVVGSGTDASARTPSDTAALRALLSDTDPVVVDAGALDLAAEATAPRILTPHDREHARLRAALGLAHAPADRVGAARETAEATGAVVLLKGAVTVVVAPDGWAATVEAGTPWLATAGTGDVLAGIIGALVAGAVAQNGHTDAVSLAALAASGAWLHGRAAAIAAQGASIAGAPSSPPFGDGPITALDVADALPQAVAETLARA
ncbi:NAD(P)H-hydrate dehydratase [Microbacterium trichothecenolyticum]|uniref:ADP-dependent NAD(P)H-hydrate dehydratase n=1 Tax=Microbacterium trichothecenolyticum TaxID=69370 RepID=UPI001C6EA806|nr:ADP/ATP-dependent (S)-NAD(P)H-hydrate dehydratase [Microbacterium trichothecenolyticum]MBW9119378.1 NAD(P)H-hydrate dehydratase [Microbacterium trichothecenolyticum]